MVIATSSIIGPAQWRPTMLGSMLGWWRADNITETSGKVSTWQDLSKANKNLTQATADNRPTQVASIINGYPVVRFTAASSTFMQASSIGSSQPMTLWAVAKLTSQIGSPVIVADGNNWGALYGVSATQVQSFLGNALVATFDMTAGFTAYVTVFNTVSSQLRANGTALASGDVGNLATTGTLYVGSYNSSLLFMDGDIAEVGLTSQALSGIGLTRLENYLRRRYATW